MLMSMLMTISCLLAKKLFAHKYAQVWGVNYALVCGLSGVLFNIKHYKHIISILMDLYQTVKQ